MRPSAEDQHLQGALFQAANVEVAQATTSLVPVLCLQVKDLQLYLQSAQVVLAHPPVVPRAPAVESSQSSRAAVWLLAPAEPAPRPEALRMVQDLQPSVEELPS